MFLEEQFSTFLTEEDYEELRASGLDAQEILQCGHFSITDAKEGKRITGIKHRGLVFRYIDPVSGSPYLTSQGKPFYRMKPRDWNEMRGDWHEDPPKYLSPPKEGNRPYWSPLIQSFNKKSKNVSAPLEIVEGEKKADSLAAEGYFVLGLSGVWGWLDKSSRSGETEIPPAQLMEDEKEDQDKLGKLEESRLLPELIDQIEWRHRRVNISFDSDLWQKTGVREAAKALACCLKELGAIPYIVRIPNELDGERNGADDFKVRHGIGAYKALCKIAQPLRIVKNKQPSIPSEPAPLGKIFMAWSVLKDEWRFRPSVGWYRWTGKFWEKRSDSEFEQALVYFQDAQDWMCTKGIDTLIRQLRSRLLFKEESWNPQRYLVFDNGVLDLETNDFTENHQREINNTSILPYLYDSNATCSTWTSFLYEALQGDTEAIALLQAFIKWILVPKPKDRKAEIEKALDLIGPKGTGKGTFLDVVTSLVGPANHGAIGSNTFKSDNGLTALLDKKVSIDYDAFGYLADVGLFNKVVSNEPVPIKFLYKDTGEARLGTVIVRAYNRVLEVPDGSEGLDRRIIAISFNHQPTEVDLELPEKLQRELSGIFTWAWSVPMKEVKRRLTWAGAVPSVAEASLKRFEANNPEYSFLAETFPDGNPRVGASDLYKSYALWCKEESGVSPKKQRKFLEAIQALGAVKSNKSDGRYYYSIPKMNEIDIAAHLGLKKLSKSFTPEILPDTPCALQDKGLILPETLPESSLTPSKSSLNTQKHQTSTGKLPPDVSGRIEAQGGLQGASQGGLNPVPERLREEQGGFEGQNSVETQNENTSTDSTDSQLPPPPFSEGETFSWWGQEVRVDRIGTATLYCLPVNGPIEGKTAFIRVPFDQAEQIRLESSAGRIEVQGGLQGASQGGLNPVPERLREEQGGFEGKTFLKTQSENSSIGLGDWVKYRKSAPEGALKVSCGSRKLQVLEIRKRSGVMEALCKAEKWFEGSWVNIAHLQFIEYGQLPKEEHAWSVGDRVRASWSGSPAGQVLEVRGSELRVLFEDSEGTDGCWVHESELTVEPGLTVGRES